MADYALTVRPLGGRFWGLDEFNGGAGVAISSGTRAPDFGGAWSDAQTAGDHLVLDGLGGIYQNAVGNQVFTKADSPDTPDYEITLTFAGKGLSTFDTGYYLGALARFDGSSAGNGYVGGIGFWMYRTSPTQVGPALCIWRYNGSTLTPLVTPVALGSSTTAAQTMKFAVAGNQLRLTHSNGTVLTVTDANLPATGKLGIYTRGNVVNGSIGWFATSYRAESGVTSGMSTWSVEGTSGSAMLIASPMQPATVIVRAGATPLTVPLLNSMQPATVSVLAGTAYSSVRTIGSVMTARQPVLAITFSRAVAAIASTGTLPALAPRVGMVRLVSPLGSVGVIPTPAISASALGVISPLAAPVSPTPIGLPSGQTIAITPLNAVGTPVFTPITGNINQLGMRIAGTIAPAVPIVTTNSLLRPAPLGALILSAPIAMGGSYTFPVAPIARPILPTGPIVRGNANIAVVAIANPAMLSVLLYDYNFFIAPLAAPMRLRFGVVSTGQDFLFWTQPLAALVRLGLGFGVSGDALIAPTPLATPMGVAFTTPTQSQLIQITPIGNPMQWATTSLSLGRGAILGGVDIRIRTFDTSLVFGAGGGFYDSNAWEPIGPDAESATYPFLTPSRDLRGLFAAASLTFRATEYKPPLRIVWLSGVGDFYLNSAGLPLTPPADGGTPVTPAAPATLPPLQNQHPLDVRIHDANDTLIFDSTQATDYSGQQYGPYLYHHQWQAAHGVMSLTQRIRFPHTELAYVVPKVIIPENGILSERVSEICTRQVTGLAAGDLAFNRNTIELSGGYNTEIAGAEATTVALYRSSPLSLSSQPGDGEGRYPGCDDTIPAAQLGSAVADEYGSIRLRGDGCYHVRPEIRIEDDQAVVTDGKLLFGNDCVPCCRCQEFAEKAAELVQLWNELQTINADSQDSRDKYDDGRNRWNQLSPPMPTTVTIKALAHNTRYMDVVIQVCYTGDTCNNQFVVGGNMTILGANAPNMAARFVPESASMTMPCGDVEPVVPGHNARFLLDIENDPRFFTLTWDLQPRSTQYVRYRLVFSGVNILTPTQVKFDLVYIVGSFNPHIIKVFDLVGTSV